MTGHLLRTIRSEVAKLRRTMAFRMALAAPMVIVTLYFLIALLSPAPMRAGGQDLWSNLTRNTISLWTVLMLPLFITLEASLLAGLEHTERNWKHLLALPVPPWTIYLAKLVTTMGLVWLAHLTLVGGTLASGLLLRAFSPTLGITSVTVGPILLPMLKVSAAVLLALTIQHWVSIRWTSFSVAMAFGMIAAVVGFVALNSPDWGPLYPWTLPMHAVDPRPDPLNPMFVGPAGAVIVAALGAWRFSHRESPS